MIDIERLRQITGSDAYVIDPKPEDVLIDLGDAFLLARRVKDGYIVQHVWGPPKKWRALFRTLAEELIRRGDGRLPVRWKPGGAVARLADRVLKPRLATSDIAGLTLAEYTAEEAILVL